MKRSLSQLRVTVCVLTYGDYPSLARQALESIRTCCRRDEYRLIVGANAVGEATLGYLKELKRSGAIDKLILSGKNLNKSPMMRRMFEHVDTEFIWWFDDDSYLTEPGVMKQWLGRARQSPPSIVMWGQEAVCNLPSDFSREDDVVGWVRRAGWYRGLPPPMWHPGGKGEFNLNGRGTGDGRWNFMVGGCWMIRTAAIRALDWPDPRLIIAGEDVLLGEAIRQQGWEIENLGSPGVRINTAARRGESA